MGRDQDAGFEWVNAWAALSKAEAASTDAAMAALTAPAAVEIAPVVASPPAETKVQVAIPAERAPDDQLMRDIVEIERARDALAAVPVAQPLAKRKTQSFTLVPSRTSDSVPVLIGSVLALVMLTVFGAAAAMGKLAR